MSASERARWDDLINSYFAVSERCTLLVQLLDSRHAPSADDRMMLEYLRHHGIPFVAALTKADKLSKQQAIRQTAAIRKQLQLPREVPFLATSAEKGTGIEDLRKLIGEAVAAR